MSSPDPAAKAHLLGDTVDDLLLAVIKEIQANGEPVSPTKGANRELTGLVLELTNPRARLSRTETKGKPFSCLGELCWYLAKSNQLAFIEYYIRIYRKYADGGVVFGGYGPRLFNWKGDQIRRAIDRLRTNPSSRKVVIQLFDANDMAEEHNDVPCTCTLQFMIRREKLQMFTHMRSNDAFIGLPHDIFCFTMLQEIVARALSTEVGIYKHSVGSLHLYDKNVVEANQYIEEGFQSTTSMPPMPLGDPWPAIDLVLQAESTIRTAGTVDDAILGKVGDYWADLIRLLQVFRCKKLKEKNFAMLETLRNSMSSSVYSPFIGKVISDLS